MSRSRQIRIAEAWFDAFNAHDLERLLALYAEDARHYSPKLKVRRPETKGLIVGKEALRQWWQDAFTRLPTLRYERTHMLADEEAVFIEYIRHVEGEEDLAVGELLEVRDGLIVGSRVYHGGTVSAEVPPAEHIQSHRLLVPAGTFHRPHGWRGQ